MNILNEELNRTKELMGIINEESDRPSDNVEKIK